MPLVINNRDRVTFDHRRRDTREIDKDQGQSPNNDYPLLMIVLMSDLLRKPLITMFYCILIESILSFSIVSRWLAKHLYIENP